MNSHLSTCDDLQSSLVLMRYMQQVGRTVHFIVAKYRCDLRIDSPLGAMTAAQQADEARRRDRAEELRLGMRVEDSEDEDERNAALYTFLSLTPRPICPQFSRSAFWASATPSRVQQPTHFKMHGDGWSA